MAEQSTVGVYETQAQAEEAVREAAWEASKEMKVGA